MEYEVGDILDFPKGARFNRGGVDEILILHCKDERFWTIHEYSVLHKVHGKEGPAMTPWGHGRMFLESELKGLKKIGSLLDLECLHPQDTSP